MMIVSQQRRLFKSSRLIPTLTQRCPPRRTYRLLSNKSEGPLRVPGINGISLAYKLPVGQRFGYGVADWRRNPRLTQVEMDMIHMMEYITEQAGWDDMIISHSSMIQAWQKKAADEHHLSPQAWEWCLAEMRDKAREFKKKGYVVIKDGDSPVARSDGIKPSVRRSLREGLTPLLDYPMTAEQSHGASPVHHLVDPSLYPLVYGRTPVLLDGGRHQFDLADPSNSAHARRAPYPNKPSRAFFNMPRDKHNAYGDFWDERAGVDYYFFSERFQWLPCEVEFPNGRTQPRVTSYINNLHPQHVEAYKGIENLLAAAIPLWEDILVSGKQGRRPMRIRTYAVPDLHGDEEITEQMDLDPLFRKRSATTDEQWAETCDKVRAYLILPDYESRLRVSNAPDQFPPDILASITPDQWESPQHLRVAMREKFNRRNIHDLPKPGISFTYDEWMAGKNTSRPIEPRVNLAYPSQPFDPLLDHRYYTVNLPGIRDGLQVIIQATSVDLTPKQPSWEGDPSYQVAGMLNERIVATAVCYYDVENIQNARVSFQQEAHINEYEFRINHNESIERGWGIPSWSSFCDTAPLPQALQDLGSVAVREGRLLSWPNTLRYKNESFSLADPTQPGHIRYITMYLVDPNYSICSTRNVPPQQPDWWKETVVDASRLSAKALPQELTGTMSPVTGEEAMDTRKQMETEKEYAMEHLRSFGTLRHNFEDFLLREVEYDLQ